MQPSLWALHLWERRRLWAWSAGVLGVLWLLGTAHAAPPVQGTPPSEPPPVYATVAVERAFVFPLPDRNTAPLTYLYERERVPVLGQNAAGTFLRVQVETLSGWVLRAQVEIEGDPALIPVLTGAQPPTPTFTPFVPPQTATARAAPPTVSLTFTPTPPAATPTALATTRIAPTADATEGAPYWLPGVPPPLQITLPEGWRSLDMVVPFRALDGSLRDLPLTIYFGALDADVYGLIYVYWGFPNTVDWATGEYNLWADGVQILRGSLIGQACNLGLYDQQTFSVGGVEGVGADYQSSDCPDEPDSAGWFVVVRAEGSTFAFYTAVDPWEALPRYRKALQTILDTVEFTPAEQQATAEP